MKKLISLSLLFIATFFSYNLLSQTVTEKGIGTVKLDRSTCRDGQPADRKKQLKAIEKAKTSAWVKYTSTFNSEKISAYDKWFSSDVLRSPIKEFIIDYVVLSSDCSKSDRTFTVVIRANINEAKLNNALRSSSGSSQTQKNLQGQGIVVLVVPRKTTEAKSFDARVTKQSMTKNSLEADELIVADENSTSITESSTQRQSVTTGGSTSSKATQRTYEIGDINDANAQINNVLAPLGMRTFNAARLESMAQRYGYEPFLNEVLNQFSGKAGDLGANISPQKQNEIIDIIIDVGQGRLNYFLLGTVDYSVPRDDPDTGAKKSDVLVNIQLFRIDDFFGAESVASVGPEIKSAFGETDVLAQTEALKKAFVEATNSLIFKL
tara:strand:+ start:2055 stop:3191 length:1137 start_codon:yes stop_codon:yes gene_type:complete